MTNISTCWLVQVFLWDLWSCKKLNLKQQLNAHLKKPSLWLALNLRLSRRLGLNSKICLIGWSTKTAWLMPKRSSQSVELSIFKLPPMSCALIYMTAVKWPHELSRLQGFHCFPCGFFGRVQPMGGPSFFYSFSWFHYFNVEAWKHRSFHWF